MPKLLGKWWEGKDGCHGVMEKLRDEAPLGFIHTRKLDITTEILPLPRRGEKEDTHGQKPGRAWFSSEEDENTDSPLHQQTYTCSLERMNTST